MYGLIAAAQAASPLDLLPTTTAGWIMAVVMVVAAAVAGHNRGRRKAEADAAQAQERARKAQDDAIRALEANVEAIERSMADKAERHAQEIRDLHDQVNKLKEDLTQERERRAAAESKAEMIEKYTAGPALNAVLHKLEQIEAHQLQIATYLPAHKGDTVIKENYGPVLNPQDIPEGEVAG